MLARLQDWYIGERWRSEALPEFKLNHYRAGSGSGDSGSIFIPENSNDGWKPNGETVYPTKAMGKVFKVHTSAECQEKTWLANFYKDAVARYSAAVADLAVSRGRIAKVGYVTLLATSEAARISAEAARLELERHTMEHGC